MKKRRCVHKSPKQLYRKGHHRKVDQPGMSIESFFRMFRIFGKDDERRRRKRKISWARKDLGNKKTTARVHNISFYVLRPAEFETSLPKGYFLISNSRLYHFLICIGGGASFTYTMSSEADGGSPDESKEERYEGQPEACTSTCVGWGVVQVSDRILDKNEQCDVNCECYQS